MSGDRAAELAQALRTLQARVDAAANAAGRDPADVELLPVTKFFPASDVVELHRLGCSSFGESRAQEASSKAAEVRAELAGESPDAVIRWHMIGRLQRNKARAVAGWARAVHAVDGVALARALDRGAREAVDSGARAEPVEVYVQLSFDGDPERGGVHAIDSGAVTEVCDAVDAAAGLEFVGLMGIPPLGADPAECFARLAGERDRLQVGRARRLGLSAGMSNDLDVAIAYGSTCVRVGTALMGARPLTSP